MRLGASARRLRPALFVAWRLSCRMSNHASGRHDFVIRFEVDLFAVNSPTSFGKGFISFRNEYYALVSGCLAVWLPGGGSPRCSLTG